VGDREDPAMTGAAERDLSHASTHAHRSLVHGNAMHVIAALDGSHARLREPGVRSESDDGGRPDHGSRISAATPCIWTKCGTTSRTLSRAQYGMSASSSGPLVIRFRPLRDCRNASSAVGYDEATRTAASAASVRSHPSAPAIRPATYASSSANAPFTPAQ